MPDTHANNLKNEIASSSTTIDIQCYTSSEPILQDAKSDLWKEPTLFSICEMTHRILMPVASARVITFQVVMGAAAAPQRSPYFQRIWWITGIILVYAKQIEGIFGYMMLYMFVLGPPYD